MARETTNAERANMAIDDSAAAKPTRHHELGVELGADDAAATLDDQLGDVPTQEEDKNADPDHVQVNEGQEDQVAADRQRAGRCQQALLCSDDDRQADPDQPRQTPVSAPTAPFRRRQGSPTARGRLRRRHSCCHSSRTLPQPESLFQPHLCAPSVHKPPESLRFGLLLVQATWLFYR